MSKTYNGESYADGSRNGMSYGTTEVKKDGRGVVVTKSAGEVSKTFSKPAPYAKMPNIKETRPKVVGSGRYGATSA